MTRRPRTHNALLLPAFAVALQALAALPSRARSPSSADEDIARLCARLGTDDTLRPYRPSLRDRTTHAFGATNPETTKRALAIYDWGGEAQYRCMNGKPLVCFMGANLPCTKIDAALPNAGAEAACRAATSGEGFVSAAEAGHDSAYSFKCRKGRALVDHTNWRLDERGFAKDLWTVLPDR